MTEPREPWWAWNALQEQLAMGKKLRLCRDGCGFMLIVVVPPRDANGIRGKPVPVTLIGEKPHPDDPTRKIGIVVIHHDICTNRRVPGNRDPARSHRITVNEDEPNVPEDQRQFRLRRVGPTLTEG